MESSDWIYDAARNLGRFGVQLTCSKVQAVFIRHPPGISHGCLRDLVHLGKG